MRVIQLSESQSVAGGAEEMMMIGTIFSVAGATMVQMSGVVPAVVTGGIGKVEVRFWQSENERFARATVANPALTQRLSSRGGKPLITAFSSQRKR